MSESPPLDLWLKRVNLLGTLLVSVAALYLSYRQWDDATRRADDNAEQITVALNEVRSRLIKVESNPPLIEMRDKLAQAEKEIAVIKARQAVNGGLSDLSRNIIAARQNVDNLLVKPTLTQTELTRQVDAYSALMNKSKPFGLKTLSDPSLSRQVLDSARIAHQFDFKNLTPEAPVNKPWHETAWDWIKKYPVIALLIAVVIVSVLTQK